MAIDICTYEYVPDNCILRVLHGFISNCLLFIGNSRKMYLCKNKYCDTFFSLTMKSRIMYYFRLFIGILFHSLVMLLGALVWINGFLSLIKEKVNM